MIHKLWIITRSVEKLWKVIDRVPIVSLVSSKIMKFSFKPSCLLDFGIGKTPRWRWKRSKIWTGVFLYSCAVMVLKYRSLSQDIWGHIKGSKILMTVRLHNSIVWDLVVWRHMVWAHKSLYNIVWGVNLKPFLFQLTWDHLVMQIHLISPLSLLLDEMPLI